MKIKIRDNALAIHDKITPANPDIPNGKKRYAWLLSEVVGKTVEVSKKCSNKDFGEGYDVKTPVTGKIIFVPIELIEEEN